MLLRRNTLGDAERTRNFGIEAASVFERNRARQILVEEYDELVELGAVAGRLGRESLGIIRVTALIVRLELAGEGLEPVNGELRGQRAGRAQQLGQRMSHRDRDRSAAGAP
jgi:hypothetical protein